jgi:tRNA threonylcarbamoyl adenosine modification protein (Sua5/YciO/YrdC/YwlC family)
LAAELLKVSAVDPDKQAIRYAVELIRRGQVVGVATDTFYGLAADPFNLAAIEEIYRVKGRPEDRALPILVNSVEQAMTLARDVPPLFLALAHKFWPGALTLLVEASNKLPLKITANKRRAALRWPGSAVIGALTEQWGAPVTGTSANISGHPSCSNAEDLMMQLGDRIPLILDSGETGALLSSTIVDLTDDGCWHVVREGLISEQEIERALKD